MKQKNEKLMFLINLTKGDNESGKEWYKSKNNLSVEWSKNAGLQLVGIWTVHKSSEDSSVDVPIKSNVKQLWANLKHWVIKPC